LDFYFLGDEELVTAFRLIGIQGMPVKDADEAVAVFRKVTEGLNETDGTPLPASISETETCQVLLITEETADWLGDNLVNWQLSGNYPLIVEIPGISGHIEGRKTLVDSIREAIGIHV
jgi:V/A-type H+-transporting ATPase subunit F